MKWLKKLTQPAKPDAPLKAKIRPVSSYLSAPRIVIFSGGPSKRQVLGNLIGTLALSDPSAALKAILSREEMGSTIIAPGLALPHARLEGLEKIEAALGICPTGVDDRHDGGHPIRLYALFVAPADNMKEHLSFLSSVSALFQQKGLLEKLTKLDTPEAVLAGIRRAEKRG